MVGQHNSFLGLSLDVNKRQNMLGKEERVTEEGIISMYLIQENREGALKDGGQQSGLTLFAEVRLLTGRGFGFYFNVRSCEAYADQG